MNRQGPGWSASLLLTRHKAAVLALAAVALGYSLYYIQGHQQQSSGIIPKPNLRRSNARRQRRRASSRLHEPTQTPAERSRYVIDAPWGLNPIDLAFLRTPEANEEVLAQHYYWSTTGDSISTPLARHLPSASEIGQVITSSEEAAALRQDLELSFLSFYFWRHLSPSPVTDEQRNILMNELERDGDFSRAIIDAALERHQDGRLTFHIEQWTDTQRQIREATSNQESRPPLDDESEHSWRGENETDDGNEAGREGQSLLNLLYRIAEEQARKDGYVHRRVTCNSCNVMPIRGIRYHCANCLDYDLCEQCEAMQIHPKNHLFYKIRIPTPFSRHSRQPEPVWYPGKPVAVHHTLEKEYVNSICKDTGYQPAEVEALWEQFRCLAATEWPEDPERYCLAMDRQTFNKCFVPQTSLHPSPPNLIYDRMFSFYDTDVNGLVGFKEFIHGLASLNRKNPGARQKRLFKAYDINDDGFVDRKDFLWMFRANYSLTRDLTRGVLAAMEEDVSGNEARDVIRGSQPISSAFTGAIPRGEASRAPEGKYQNNYGDYTVFDGIGAVDNREHDFEDPDQTLADAQEVARYGVVKGKSTVINCGFLYSDPWPPRCIVEEDVEKVLAPALPAEEVTLPEDQYSIRRVAHARIAHWSQRRSFARRQVIRDRKRRRAFYLDGENDTALTTTADSHRTDSIDVARNDSTQSRTLQNLVGAGQSGKFYTMVAEKIEELNWPVMDSFMGLSLEIGELILLGWSGTEIAEDLSGYAHEFNASKDFVTSISDSLEEMAKELRLEIQAEDEMPVDQPQESLLSSRRSRSSSKVRFHEDLGTEAEHESRSRATSISSRNIPVNERWGSLLAPEPEKDVGREVLYQVTQEAFNELLDPIFRLREDLALAVFQTGHLREKHRAEIIATVDDPLFIQRELNEYQRWWRTEPFKKITTSGEAPFQIDEAKTFFSFYAQRLAGEENPLTCEKCSRCARNGEDRWVGIGHYCRECGLASRTRREEDEEELSSRKELCSACAEKGEDFYLSPRSLCCQRGHPSSTATSERARLRAIISGHHSQSSARVVAINEDQDTNGNANSALELNSSVPSLNEADAPPSEEQLARFAESDHRLRTLLERLRASHDPTMPQNRPNGISSPEPRSTENDLPESTSPLDATLPQNRPNTLLFSTNESIEDTRPPTPTLSENRSQDSSPQLDPTLPQNRPNTIPATSFVATRDTELRQPVKPPQAGSTDNPKQRKRNREKRPNRTTLLYYAALDIIEAEDKERGGPGRLSFSEWEQVMNSEKGNALAFLGTWIDNAGF